MKFTCFTLVVFYLAVASARPQESFHPEPPIQKKAGFRIETREILEKIDEVNKKHGFIPNLREQREEEENSSRKFKGIFFDDVFSNPILEYLKNNGQQEVTTYSVGDEDREQATEDKEELGVVRRKVTHQQTIFVPQFNDYQYPQNQFQLSQNQYQLPENNQIPVFYQQSGLVPTQHRNEDLEGITVNNIKNLLKSNYQQTLENSNNYPPRQYYYYYPLPPGNFFKTSDPRQATINMPFQEYFPIVIRNPFQMMFNAFTSMVEYGQAVNGNCKSDLREAKGSKLLDTKKIKEDVEGREVTEDDEEEEEEQGGEVEEGRKREEEKSKDGGFKPPNWFNNKLGFQKQKTTTVRPAQADYDKLGEDVEDEVTNFSSSDKGFLNALHHRKSSGTSKDNTGSGIFIHKLKVRKGGVAIAGPGGIATAGSGGTAIVGPNGLAFTHPDSLAIAGSGTKVVAVDPAINLSDLVNNKTRFDGSSPRVGKVVATGPVIYYNKG